jgi:predicted transcriptional regulator
VQSAAGRTGGGGKSPVADQLEARVSQLAELVEQCRQWQAEETAARQRDSQVLTDELERGSANEQQIKELERRVARLEVRRSSPPGGGGGGPGFPPDDRGDDYKDSKPGLFPHGDGDESAATKVWTPIARASLSTEEIIAYMVIVKRSPNQFNIDDQDIERNIDSVDSRMQKKRHFKETILTAADSPYIYRSATKFLRKVEPTYDLFKHADATLPLYQNLRDGLGKLNDLLHNDVEGAEGNDEAPVLKKLLLQRYTLTDFKENEYRHNSTI